MYISIKIKKFLLNIHKPFLRNPPYGRLRRNGQAPALCAPMPCPAPHSLSPKGSKGSTPQNMASALIPKTAIFKNFFAFGETNFVKISALERRRCLTVAAQSSLRSDCAATVRLGGYAPTEPLPCSVLPALCGQRALRTTMAQRSAQ